MTEVGEEIAALANASGVIYPAAVVEWARAHPESALHRQFNWDIEKAAREHWLYTARKLISVHVVSDAGDRQTIALTIDYHSGGGYRPMDRVLATAELRRAAVLDALGELERWHSRHKALAPELEPVFRALTRVARRMEPPAEAA